MKFLILDTSTERGFVAIAEEGKVLVEHHMPFGLQQSVHLFPALEQCLHTLEGPIEAIGIGVGPGSYTGIRMGLAAAQGLAYGWKVPLVTCSSLIGFISADSSKSFAAVVDARMGGFYIQRGEWKIDQIVFEPEPLVISLEDVPLYLEGIESLVSPSIQQLKVKLEKRLPHKIWTWEERASSPQNILREVERKFELHEFYRMPEQVHINYLRETQAEREKRAKEIKGIHE